MTHTSLLDTQRRLSPRLVLAPAVDGTWELPAEYTPYHAPAEYDATRRASGAGVVDRSWRSLLRLTGPDRHAFLQGMVTNDILALAPNQGCRAAFLDTTAHILADMRVWNAPDALFLVTDPQVSARLLQTLDMYLIMEDVQIADVSADWALLSVLGPGALSAVAPLLSTPLPPDLPPMTLHPAVYSGGANGFVAVPDASDLPGLDLWLPASSAPAVWEALLSGGVVPVGERAADVLRIEAGNPIWGRELSDAVLLPEADLPDAISYTKGCYLGQEIIARLRARGHANRALRGILLPASAPVPHEGATLHAPEYGQDAGREIGRITSAAASPAFSGRALALGYVRREFVEHGTAIAVHLPQPDGTVFTFPGIVLTRPFSLPE